MSNQRFLVIPIDDQNEPTLEDLMKQTGGIVMSKDEIIGVNTDNAESILSKGSLSGRIKLGGQIKGGVGNKKPLKPR